MALPSGWGIVARLSDEGEGLIAMAPEGNSGDTATAYLDASQVVRLPASSAQAMTTALEREECAKPSTCTILANETVPGGYLVSIRMPHGIAIESWRSAPREQAVRCGFEKPVLGEAASHGPTWLDDPDAVARVRSEGADLCRSVTVTP